MPAAAITLVLTLSEYVECREMPAMDALLYGIQPVVLAIMAVAMVTLAPKAADDPAHARHVRRRAGALGSSASTNWPCSPSARSPSRRPIRRVAWPVAAVGACQIRPPRGCWTRHRRRRRTRRRPGRLRVGVLGAFGNTLFGSGYLLVAYWQADVVERNGS